MSNMSQAMQPAMSSSYVTFDKLDELDAVQINHPQFNATILKQGAQLIHFSTRAMPDNWLWLGQNVAYKHGQAVRGGVPICFPLFGNYADNPMSVQDSFPQGLPKHGLARQVDWQLLAIDLTEPTGANLLKTADTLSMTFSLSFAPTILDQYPTYNLAALATTVRFDFQADGFSICLQMHNQSNKTIHLSQALHSYFATDDIAHTAVQGLDGVNYIDYLMDKTQEKAQIGAVTFKYEVDRLYQGAPLLTIVTPSHQTQLIAEGSHSTIVWNPWIDKALRLDQFAPTDYQKMVCVETTNAGTDSLALAPNQQHHLKMTVTRPKKE